MLIDTSNFIDHLRGREEATQFLNSTRQSSVGLVTCIIVAAELLTGARDRREQREIDRLLVAFHGEPILAIDCPAALNLLRQHRPTHGIDWPDCLIAVIATRLGHSVATLNDRHFRAIPALAVHRPY